MSKKGMASWCGVVYSGLALGKLQTKPGRQPHDLLALITARLTPHQILHRVRAGGGDDCIVPGKGPPDTRQRSYRTAEASLRPMLRARRVISSLTSGLTRSLMSCASESSYEYMMLVSKMGRNWLASATMTFRTRAIRCRRSKETGPGCSVTSPSTMSGSGGPIQM